MIDEVRERTERIIRELRETGRVHEADDLQRALRTPIADAFPLALREACQTVLTAIEAIDPNTEMLLEQLRTKIDLLLTPYHPVEPTEDSGTTGGV